MSELQLIPCQKISWPHQERKHFGQEELAELAATIRANGILEPLGVFREGDKYVGVYGQRRWLAAELAGLESVPAIVREKPATGANAMEIRLIENTARESLRPLEQATALDQLMKLGRYSASEVAKRVGMKPAAVTKALALLNLPEPIRQKIDAGLISAGAGYELARMEDAQLQSALAEQVASGSLSRDALSGKIKAAKRGGVDPGESRSRVTAMLDGGRTVTVAGSGLGTLEGVIACLEELLAKARKVRSQNLALGTFIKMLKDQAKA